MAADTGWMADAACKGMPTELFFPTRGESSKEAKAVCAVCPVRAECREYGRRERCGVWGGLSERQRSGTRGRPQLRPHGTYAAAKRCTDGPDGAICDDCHLALKKYKNAHRHRDEAAS